MKKINFVNRPNTSTPINNTNLNLLQDNVDEAINDTITVAIKGNEIITKFADGTMIIRGQQTFNNVPFGNSYLGGYRTSIVEINDFQESFIDVPDVFFNIKSLECSSSAIVDVHFVNWIGSGRTTTSTNPGKPTLYSSQQITATSVTIGYTAIGRWK